MNDSRAACTRRVLDDLASLWQHMDREHPIESADGAAAMARAGVNILLEAEPGSLTLADAMSQAVLLLVMVREALLEHEEREKSAEAGI